MLEKLTSVRECHGQPWGFPGPPTPVPIKTRTRTHGYGFARVWVMGFTKPVQIKTRIIIQQPRERLGTNIK